MTRFTVISLYIIIGCIYRSWIKPNSFVDLPSRIALMMIGSLRRCAMATASNNIKAAIIMASINGLIIYVLSAIAMWPATLIEQLLTYNNTITDEAQDTTD